MVLGLPHVVLLFAMLILLIGITYKEYWTVLRFSTIVSLLIYILWVYMRKDYLEEPVKVVVDIMFVIGFGYSIIYYLLAYVFNKIDVKIDKNTFLFNVLYDREQFEEYEQKVLNKKRQELGLEQVDYSQLEEEEEDSLEDTVDIEEDSLEDKTSKTDDTSKDTEELETEDEFGLDDNAKEELFRYEQSKEDNKDNKDNNL